MVVRKIIVSLQIYCLISLASSLLPGNELKVSVKAPGMEKPWSAKGVVYFITDKEEICLEIRDQKVPSHITTNFRVEFV